MKDEYVPGKIRILDSRTVNRIAAGEVIERPASVVKELVENAIDADARRIRIEISSSQGLVAAIQIIDDGTGMVSSDALLAFTAHATSKITSADDIDTVMTCGFRGEALSSIAAVSKVTLLTKERGCNSVSGTRVVIEGGQVIECCEAASVEGTNILVTDLFYNTPARKKFQKTLTTEIAHITAIVEGIALAYPEVSLDLIHNDRGLISTEPSARLIDTIARIFGTEVIPSLIPVNYEHPLVTLKGFISLPSVIRKNPSRILTAINRRFVTSVPVTSAILEGYGTLIPKDRYPVAFLSLAIDPRSVDVNVHPAKRYVRLNREGQIRDIIRDAVRTALRCADLIPQAESTAGMKSGMMQKATGQITPYQHIPQSYGGVSETTHPGTVMTERQLRQTELKTGTGPETGLIPEMELIGQFGGIYLLATTMTGDLIVIDQHAAHERIMYDLVCERESRSPQLSQELIVPVVLERSARDAAVIRDLVPVLENEGFAIGEFGRNSFIVSAMPVILGKIENAASLITEIADDLTGEDLKNPVTRREQVMRIIACRGAIKAGTVCSSEQCRRLLQQLARTKNPHTCPHGRPTMVRFSRYQLDALFKRA